MNHFFKILIFCFCLLQHAKGVAQDRRDKLEALRVSFISKQLELSGTEYEKFWPVYNEYNDKIKAVRKNLRQSYRNKPAELSEADAEELYQLEVKSKQAEVDLYKQYSLKLKDIIGTKKLVRLRVAEEQFKREMIHSIQQDRGD